MFVPKPRGRKSAPKSKIVDAAVVAAGNQTRLAKAIGVSHQAITHWRRIPAELVIRVEQATGIPREQLRPDIFLAPRARHVGWRV